MSFFSWSSKRKPYKYGKYGSSHYKRKGLLEKLLFSSHSHSYYGHRPNYIPIHERPNLKKITCKNCHAQIPASSKFCLECGAKVEAARFCENCGQSLPAGAKFCSNCGSKMM